MNEFSPKTLALLTSAAWDENYRCKVASFINPHNYECSPPNQVITDFMERFGGLKINTWYEFNRAFPINFLKSPECEDYSHFAERLGLEAPLIAYVIGNSHAGHIDLFITNNGHVYGHYDKELWKFGDSGIEAIEIYVMTNG